MSKQFLCVLRNASGGCEEPSQETMNDMYAKFQQWHEKFADNIVDMGGKLIGDGKILTSNGTIEGPFTENGEFIGGFMIVSGDTIEDAIKVVSACPPVAASLGNTSVEVRELVRG